MLIFYTGGRSVNIVNNWLVISAIVQGQYIETYTG